MNFHLKRVKCAHGKENLLPDKQVFHLSGFPFKHGKWYIIMYRYYAGNKKLLPHTVSIYQSSR